VEVGRITGIGRKIAEKGSRGERRRTSRGKEHPRGGDNVASRGERSRNRVLGEVNLG